MRLSATSSYSDLLERQIPLPGYIHPICLTRYGDLSRFLFCFEYHTLLLELGLNPLHVFLVPANRLSLVGFLPEDCSRILLDFFLPAVTSVYLSLRPVHHGYDEQQLPSESVDRRKGGTVFIFNMVQTRCQVLLGLLPRRNAEPL